MAEDIDDSTEVGTSTKQDVSEAARVIRQGGSAVLNPTGKGGFADNPGNRSDGSWKKENTPRGKLEKLLSEVSLGEFLEQVANNVDTNLDQKLGDVLISGRLKNVIKQDPDSGDGKITVDSNELDKLLYFVYGSKSENDTTLRDEGGVVLVKGFVIPTLPGDVNGNSNSNPDTH